MSARDPQSDWDLAKPYLVIAAIFVPLILLCPLMPWILS